MIKVKSVYCKIYTLLQKSNLSFVEELLARHLVTLGVVLGGTKNGAK